MGIPSDLWSLPMPQPTSGHGRNFLFLQGPHGPFFRQLGAALTATGAKVWRVGFTGRSRKNSARGTAFATPRAGDCL